MDWKLFVSTFSLIFFAELPDKTAFATLLLATRGSPWAVFIGVCLAFFVQSLIAVAFGSFFGALLQHWMPLIAGALFLGFALFSWFRKEEELEKEEEKEVERELPTRATSLKIIARSFVVIFIAEWGDLTQMASASLAAKFQAPVTIFTASTLALWCVTAIAITVGSRAKSIISPELLTRIVSIAMGLLGIYFITSWFIRAP